MAMKRLARFAAGFACASSCSAAALDPSPLLLWGLGYDRIHFGVEPAFEAGAVVARVGDASAAWYNPAGLADADRTSLATTGTGFAAWQLDIAGGSERIRSLDFWSAPTFAAAAIGDPPLGGSRWRVGLSVAQQYEWNHGVDAELQHEGGAASSTVGGQAGFSSYVVGASVGTRFGPRWRVGLRLDGSWTGLSSSLETATSRDSVRTVRLYVVDGEVWHLFAGGGVQWVPLPALALGATLRLRGLRVAGDGRLMLESLSSAAGTAPAHGRDTSARFDYEMPLEASFGVAWRSPALELEVDARWHNATERYALVRSDALGVEIPYRARTVANLSVGARVAITRSTTLHLGIFTDRTPVAATTLAIPRLDLYGVSGGLSLRGKQVSAALGIEYVAGGSRSLLVQLPDEPPLRINVDARSLAIRWSFGFEL
jgi:long-subunit fatty acid transport protein